MHNIKQLLILKKKKKICIAIFKPNVVRKCMSTQSGEFEDGAEVYLLSDEDLNHNFAKDFFQIKLGYNGIHHYFPIVPKGVMQFFDAFDSVTHYSINLRKVLKSLSDQAPRDTNFQKLVSEAHQNLVATTVLSGLNPLGQQGQQEQQLQQILVSLFLLNLASHLLLLENLLAKRGAWILHLKHTNKITRKNRRRRKKM